MRFALIIFWLNHDASREIRFYLRKEFRAAEIEFLSTQRIQRGRDPISSTQRIPSSRDPILSTQTVYVVKFSSRCARLVVIDLNM